MYAKLDEEHYVENPFLAQLQMQGWKVYRQNKGDPEDIREIVSFTRSFEPKYGNRVKFRESFREIILEDVLKESIKRINPWIDDDKINLAVHRITTPQARSLLEVNREIHNLLLEGFPVSESSETGEKNAIVHYIDFKTPENNSFIAISQFKVNITGTEKHIIPDIVLFVNGIPLVVVECKSPTISDPINEAITQLMRYSNRRGVKEGNEKLFWYNLFTIATTNQVAKYGSITANYEHFVEWKDPYPSKLQNINIGTSSYTSQQVLILGMLTRSKIIDILHTFTVFKDDEAGTIKIVPRYQQYRAVKRIIKRLKEGKAPEERGGIIWHTQGSGKSLTMVFTIRSMNHDKYLRGWKVVLVTDRKSLQKQLKETTGSIGYTVNLASSIEMLKELLRTDTPDIVMAMVHKFQERDLKKMFPVLNTSEKILVMIDEAHRTQYKYLGANLRKALPRTTRLAFTGTPIDKTEKTFGDYIDKYSIRQAVEDGVTVEIVYEGRVHSAELSDEEAANAKFEDVFSQIDKNEQAKIMGRYTWRAYLEDYAVIRDKAKDMIKHYIEYVYPNGFKAQVVAVSRIGAVRYKQALEDALGEIIAKLEKNNPKNIDVETLKKMRVEVVISGAPNDEPEMKKYTNSNKHEVIIKSFKLPFNSKDEKGISGDVGIIVVNRMLITGFDAPIEQVMYLDNVLKDHNLLQAIARVNRVYRDKSCGFVVDYVGVLKHLRKALAIYASEDIEEISSVVVNKSKAYDELELVHAEIENFFEKYNIENWRKNINECVDLLIDEDTRNDFIALVRKFNKTMDKVLPDPKALKYASDLKILNFIKATARERFRDDKLSLRDASKKIREIVEEYLISKGVNPKIPPTPLFSDGFIEKIESKPPKVRAQELEYAIREYIIKHFEEDPEMYERFSELLKRILEEYKNNWEILSEQLKILRERMKKGRAGENTFGFDPKKEMPYFGLLKREIFGKVTMEKLNKDDIDLLVSLTKDITSLIKKSIEQVDFWENDIAQKRVRAYIINHILLQSVNKMPNKKEIMKKRNEIAQKLMELSAHLYGG